ncbi:bifunctional phosphoribosyl-AMP cyclohydrolase/phosphoribosyl-ATP diphosphatase HisIE [Campylobacter sp.]|uniref:bifunctional phosphoribosyl-AMP cyclohydrolase/phosphoribosyl-ATP diphosphatase HisIE n=1 Tax=Campylobacter sp. TaxID=205 RepID=UPI0026F53A00|nr:bifunctional phosphoribosyl-AMP cyclohydrolase/phosphoribosyl-ATP diphosphatase HisIE [Campylobacter sp.]
MKIDWDKVAGLMPVIVQESATNEVLMLAYMNEEALNLSMQTGLAHYFSRTKNRIWKKGETSGNIQKIESMYLDCDNDTLLIKVEQIGAVACHTGEKSCFFRKLEMSQKEEQAACKEQNLAKPNYGVIDEIYHTILERKLNADPKNSYVASLFAKGENAILKKVGEEATEFVIACKDVSKYKDESKILSSQPQENQKIEQNLLEEMLEKAKNDMIYEAADLCFHMLVALALHGIHPEHIKAELARRNGISGIAEKNSRNAK